MGRKSLKKVAGHAGLEPGERVLDACWGMGRGVLSAADIAGLTIVGELVRDRPTYEHQLDAMSSGEGMASLIDRNGILALTDRRLLWMPVSTAVTKPKAIAAAIPLEDVEAIAYEKPILAVRFSDGSSGGFHTTANEEPDSFVHAWSSIRQG